MKKRIWATVIVLIFVVHWGYFILWPTIGWKPCGNIDQKNLEYVQYQDVDGRYTLSENEIEQFIEYVRQIRVYPMPGNLHYETREFKFYYKYLGQSEEKILQLTSEFVKYNNEIFHVGENYWRLYNEELKLWCYSLKK
jgi:hypothetical protein